MVILMCGYLRNTDTLPYLHKGPFFGNCIVTLLRLPWIPILAHSVFSGLVVSMRRVHRTPHSVQVQGTAKVRPFD